VSLRLPKIYAITDRAVSGGLTPSAAAERLLRVGIRCVQVREKTIADRELLPEVEAVARLGREAGARVLVDDRVDVARIAAVGVHLGEDDLPAAAARAILSPESTIGVSTHDLAAARRAFDDAQADYVAFGPIFRRASGRHGGWRSSHASPARRRSLSSRSAASPRIGYRPSSRPEPTPPP
jgi:thiamine-phosphate pyrophosphorylase